MEREGEGRKGMGRNVELHHLFLSNLTTVHFKLFSLPMKM